MEHIFSALIPVFGLILIGYFFKRIKFPSHEFWPQADKLTYYILMPALLIYELSNASLNSKNSFSFVMAALLAIFFTMIILIIINKIKPTNASSFTSVIQGGIRFNTYVFLALSGAIFGKEGLILSAIILTFTIPFINVLCITIFALYVSNDKLHFLYLIKSIITNPLIVACVIGGTINFIGIEFPVVINNTLAILSKAALPMGLLSVGFGLVIKEISSFKSELIISSFAKHLIMPILIFIFAKYFELDNMMISILVLFAVLPTAPSSFILARQLGGNMGLMSSIITVQTLLSALFIIIFLKIFI
ncbi:transporter [Arcobacter suis]|uniref:Permease n=1 Tax=Arcobacter suis CECT 7833 TaxID=663365 RepID=A0AAD0WQX5_9BACT|nr:AEC family transporter [Arcobacter suis]AXX90211.1 putative permease [Arcobacter suis CECT 7833]RWS45537.1 transporter [Arcobacter suis]